MEPQDQAALDALGVELDHELERRVAAVVEWVEGCSPEALVAAMLQLCSVLWPDEAQDE